MQSQDDKVIATHRTLNPAFACADVRARCADARRKHVTFFEDPAHQDRVAQVKQIVEDFFTVRQAVYVNERDGHGKPFTVIKVSQPQFPRMSHKQIDTLYREPLKSLGVEVVFSKGTNSYLFRVR